MEFLLSYEWEIFFIIELTSLLSLFLFAILRYLFAKVKVSYLFLCLFITTILLEAGLALMLYQLTKEVTTLQIVILIFVLYAISFGIDDFRKFDRYIKIKVGKWKGIDLLSNKDRLAMQKLQDPKFLSRKARRSFYLHTMIFALSLIGFWLYDGNQAYPPQYFLTHLDWFSDPTSAAQPFHSEILVNVLQVWLVIYVVDSIINLYDSLYPKKEKTD